MKLEDKIQKSDLNEQVENVLKNVWIRIYEERKESPISDFDSNSIEELISKGYAHKENGEVKLTREGERAARKIVRLHRLAERLLSDVLGISENDTERSACLFEHVLSEEVEEAICTLLGHPTICPHGRKIPEGSCCLQGANQVERLIFRVSELNPGDEAEVKYLLAEDVILQKIISVGMLPGKRFKVVRVFPAYVIQIGNTNFAIDKSIADTIYALKL